ncbi:MAG TPA: hypothetical protein VNH44_16875, partial [Micropepsaceae bacterium]|nr:hypothetical protein [Micropepsaceae bacterium]
MTRRMLKQKLVLLLSSLMAATQLSAQLPAARLLTVFPPGAEAGSSIDVAISGVDLDDPTQLYFSHPGIKAKLKIAEKTRQPETNRFVVTISAEVPPGLYDARFVGRFGASNPRAFAVGDLNEICEP